MAVVAVRSWPTEQLTSRAESEDVQRTFFCIQFFNTAFPVLRHSLEVVLCCMLRETVVILSVCGYAYTYQFAYALFHLRRKVFLFLFNLHFLLHGRF